MTDRKKRAAVIYSSIGTGHKTAAYALCEWFSKVNVDTICLDALAYVNPIIREFMPDPTGDGTQSPSDLGYFYESTDSPEASIGVSRGAS